MVSDHKGRVLWYENTRPYGESLGKVSSSGLGHLDNVVSETTSQLGYTGHTVDSTSGLVYMKARHYDPVIGRFYSNDPVGFKASNPMMFNRYAYANNNPYTFVDPDGREGEEADEDATNGREQYEELGLVDSASAAANAGVMVDQLMAAVGEGTTWLVGGVVGGAKKGISALSKVSGFAANGTLTAGKNFKGHFSRARSLVQNALGVEIGKYKAGGGDELLEAISDGIKTGIFKSAGKGTLKKDDQIMNIYRGEGLTIVGTQSGEFVTVLKSGQGLDNHIFILP